MDCRYGSRRKISLVEKDEDRTAAMVIRLLSAVSKATMQGTRRGDNGKFYLHLAG